MSSNRFDTYDKEQMIGNAQKLFSRLRQTLPFPITAENNFELSLSLIDQEYATRIKDLWNSPYCAVLENNRITYLHIKLPLSVVRIAIKFPDNYPDFGAAKQPLIYVSPDSKHYHAVLNWTNYALDIDSRIKKGVNVISNLINQCNTPGQMNTVFPEFVHFLQDHHKQTVINSIRKSPWPKRLGDRDAFASKIDEIRNLTSTCLLLEPNNTPSIWIT